MSNLTQAYLDAKKAAELGVQIRTHVDQTTSGRVCVTLMVDDCGVIICITPESRETLGAAVDRALQLYFQQEPPISDIKPDCFL